ncbi:MAG: hypothetical protein IMF01_09235 [Proteobacteria bacterium]|nr:hypothetical protein [Pseudomonadota bacterium]
MRLLSILVSLLILFPKIAIAQEEHFFDLSEIEKKPYHIGGYLEFRPVLYSLDKDSSLYKLRFYNRNEGNTVDEYNFTIQIDGSYEKGIVKLYTKINTDFQESYLGWSEETDLYEGYLSLKPSPSLTLEIGKKTLKWGKGYAWTPIAFVDRIKNPDDPELALEGYVVASADYIKSFDGSLKTFSFTPVLVPVYDHINSDFGSIDHLNFAGKLYFLLYDTDIDFIFLVGGSKSNRYGIDFSRNITTNLEIHGEFAFFNDYKKVYVDRAGSIFTTEYDATSYLIGLRYLTSLETTFILEYYHNERGFSRSAMKDYFSFIDSGYNLYNSTGDDSILKMASHVTKKNYAWINPMRDYLFLRIMQKEPFNILYFTPAITGIFNLKDQSFFLSPELLYYAITNLELRLKTTFLIGDTYTEYGEKASDYRLELRVRYYF